MKNKIDIEHGRYWDQPWSLVDGCTPCSPGCAHCWSAAMTARFQRQFDRWQKYGILVDENGRFNGDIITHTDRLNIPLKTRKPTVFAVWNDLFHEAVPDEFMVQSYEVMACGPKHHAYLILSKRPQNMVKFWDVHKDGADEIPNIWHGLTVCNQEEVDEKIPVFLRVPGKKFLSIEPMLGAVDLTRLLWHRNENGAPHVINCLTGFHGAAQPVYDMGLKIDAVILGGETGPGARPMHPDWVRSVRDQCAAAGVPFYFKSWGAYGLNWLNDDNGKIDGSEWMDKGIKHPGRLLDGRTHDDLPWVK
jgi:protein gp37